MEYKPFKIHGEIIHDRYFKTLKNSDYRSDGNYYQEYVDVGKWRTTTIKPSVAIYNYHIFEVLTTEGVFRSEEIPIFIKYRQEGNSLIPYNTKEHGKH